jgi:hypothetical protein
MRQLEEDLGTFKEKNRELQDELQKKAGAVQQRYSENFETHLCTRIWLLLDYMIVFIFL